MKSRRLISDIRISFVVKSARNFHERTYNLNPVKAVYWLSVIFLAALFLMQCFFGVMMADKTVYKFDNLVFFCNCDKRTFYAFSDFCNLFSIQNAKLSWLKNFKVCFFLLLCAVGLSPI